MIPVRQSIGGLGNLMFKQAYLYSQFREGLIPDLYVQSEKYFEKHKEEIKQLFGSGIGFINRVSLQIRLGDYLNSDFYINLTETDYYQKAVQQFPNDRFLVFCFDRQDPETDKLDREYAKSFLDTFIPDRYELCEPRNETDDLNAMASCKSNIIANSTFGWWAAYLGKHEKIVTPANWFTDGVQRCELLNDWIKL